MFIKIAVIACVVIFWLYVTVAGYQAIKRIFTAPDPDLHLTYISVRDALWSPFSFISHIQVKATPRLELRLEDAFIFRPSGPALITSADIARFKQYHLLFKNPSSTTKLHHLRFEVQLPYGVTACEILQQNGIGGLRATPEEVVIGFSGGGSIQTTRRPLTPRLIMTMDEALPDAGADVLLTLDLRSNRWGAPDIPSIESAVLFYVLGEFSQSVGDNPVEGRVFYTIDRDSESRLVLGPRLDAFPKYVLMQGADF